MADEYLEGKMDDFKKGRAPLEDSSEGVPDADEVDEIAGGVQSSFSEMVIPGTKPTSAEVAALGSTGLNVLEDPPTPETAVHHTGEGDEGNFNVERNPKYAKKIPIKGPAGNDDPATIQWRKENWVDKPTALDMAEAGKPSRDEAIDKRERLQFSKDYEDAVREARGRTPFGRRKRLDELWFDPRFDGHEDIEGWGIRRAATRAYETGGDREKSRFLAEMRNQLEEYARLADEKAERLEDWAETLNKNRPTEAYEAAHPKIKFGPQSLAAIERWIPTDEAEIEDLREEAKEIDDESRENAVRRTTDLLYFLEDSGLPTEEFDRRMQELNRSDTATTPDYRKLYRDVLEVRTEYTSKKLEERKQVIDDVRSGLAADPNYKPPEPMFLRDLPPETTESKT